MTPKHIGRSSRPYWMRRKRDQNLVAQRDRQQGVPRNVVIAALTAFVTAIAAIAGPAAWHWAERNYYKLSDKSDVEALAIPERISWVQGEHWILPEKLSISPQDQQRLADPFPGYETSAVESFHSWTRKKGFADPQVSFLKLIVQGGGHQSVRVVGMKAFIKKRTDPLRGLLLYAPPQGGNDVTQIGFNLNETEPIARSIERDGATGNNEFRAPYFDAKQTKTLTHGEQEVFHVEGRTDRYYVEWCVGIDLLVGLRQRSLQICPEGRAVRTTAFRFRPGNYGPAIAFPEYKQVYALNMDTGKYISKDPNTYDGI